MDSNELEINTGLFLIRTELLAGISVALGGLLWLCWTSLVKQALAVLPGDVRFMALSNLRGSSVTGTNIVEIWRVLAGLVKTIIVKKPVHIY